MRRTAISGWERATRSTLAETAMDSVASRLRNLRRAGTFPNRFSTMMVVPSRQPRSEMPTICPPLISSIAPMSSSRRLDRIRISETEEMAARASPRNPRVRMPSRSSALRILLVAWRRMAMGRSSADIPHPSSVTRMKVTPPFWISTVMCLAPASMEFSIISLMAEAGRSTTSPAAMRLATSKDRTWMLPMAFSFLE